jgi:3-methyladenine DNA glycosylase Mpg
VNSTLFNQILEPSWLERPSTEVAPDLLGCTLVRQLPDGKIIKQPGIGLSQGTDLPWRWYISNCPAVSKF